MLSTPAIAKARARLGAEPLRRVFVEVARTLATPGTTGAWYRGRRVLAIDGTCLDVADTRPSGWLRPAKQRPGALVGSRRSACP